MLVTAKLVKQLRERTGAGMMECKKILLNTKGDIEKAIVEMRKSGQTNADKKSSRIASEGYITIKKHENTIFMVEVNSETDFVSRDNNFRDFVQRLIEAIATSNTINLNDIKSLVLDNGNTVDQERKMLISKVGENIQIRRVSKVQGDLVSHYVHGDGIIGVIIALKGGDLGLARDIAVHIAASDPKVVSTNQVSREIIEKEKEIFLDQAKRSGKPENIIKNIVQGRINKFINEQTLLEQHFVKNLDKKIKELLQEKNAEVIEFVRFKVGEGIERADTDFASEVMSQAQRS